MVLNDVQTTRRVALDDNPESIESAFLISTAIVPKVIPSVLHMNATGCSD